MCFNLKVAVCKIKLRVINKILRIKKTKKQKLESYSNCPVICINNNQNDEYQFEMRMLYPDTIDRLLFETGFLIKQKLGDYDGRSFNENSLLQIYVCSKK